MAPPRRNVALLDDGAALAAAYQSSSLAELADQLDVSASTVRRALVRHGIDRRPRHRRLKRADVLDDPASLAEQYRTRTGVEIAEELGVSARTVYAAMERHGIERRSDPGALSLKRPQLADPEWLASAVERGSSTSIAAELEVSPGTVAIAYERADIDAASTTKLYARGRPRERPSPAELHEIWEGERRVRGVARRIGTTHATASVWLAEVGIFADEMPKISRGALEEAIRQRQSQREVAAEHGVSVTTVRVELHRHGLFETPTATPRQVVGRCAVRGRGR